MYGRNNYPMMGFLIKTTLILIFFGAVFNPFLPWLGKLFGYIIIFIPYIILIGGIIGFIQIGKAIYDHKEHKETEKNEGAFIFSHKRYGDIKLYPDRIETSKGKTIAIAMIEDEGFSGSDSAIKLVCTDEKGSIETQSLQFESSADAHRFRKKLAKLTDHLELHVNRYSSTLMRKRV